MRWILVAVVAEVLVALALAAAVSYAASSTTCVTYFTYGGSNRPGANQSPGVPPRTTSETCSRHLWWD